jgi:hypothetical protein
MDFNILGIKRSIEDLRKQLLNHELYQHLESMDQLQLFMEQHVFAVWDFMVLLKALQRKLTSTGEAWVPSDNKVARRLINDIVLAEESDLDINNQPSSHYEMYLAAMKQCGADTRDINRLVQMAKEGHSLKSLVRYNVAEMDAASLNFVKNSYDVVKGNKVHEIAAAFSFGREDLVPGLFTELVRNLNQKFGGTLSAFVYYLERHIELDGEEHGPMAEQMISELCGNDEIKWQEAEKAAKQALEARLALWDAITLKLKELSIKNLAQPA